MVNGKPVKNPKSDIGYLTPVEKLEVRQGLQLEAAEEYAGAPGTSVEVSLRMKSLSGKYPLSWPTLVRYRFYEKGNPTAVNQGEVLFTPYKDNANNWLGTVTISLPEKPGNYRVKFSFYSETLGDWGAWKSTSFSVQ